MSDETKIVYYLGDEQTPYVSKINLPPDSITLGDFKAAIKKINYKFFFKSTDADFGVVKEEVTNDKSILPLCDNRIVAWLKAPDMDSVSQCSLNSNTLPMQDKNEDMQLRPNSTNEGELSIENKRVSPHYPLYNRYGSQSTLMSSDIETTSWDSRDDMSEYSTCTDMTASSRRKPRPKRQRYKKKRPRPGSDTTSTYSSSITDSSMSLNILTVTLNMEKYNFLGISIVGQTNDKGDGGIYIGSIMKGGAVAADNRIEPGDMLLQVNEVNFENMSNEDAVRVLRNIVHKPGPITLTVAKCWDPNPDNYFTIPKDEPVRPIDPAAWANHIMTVKGDMHGPSPPYSLNPESSSASSLPESERYDMPLSTCTDMGAVVKSLKMPDSGLDVKTRMWLKITIPNAFIGSDLVDWLQQKVHGLTERRDARKYASSLLKAGYIRHTVNKITFSEQCYYVFGDYTGTLDKDMSNLSLVESNSDRDSDTLGPLHGHHNTQPWMHQPSTSNHGYASYSQYPYTQSGQLSVGPPIPLNNGISSMVDYSSPPPTYPGLASHHSDGDNLSVHSAHSLHRAASEASTYRQHLATFGANGNNSAGSESESRYSSRSGKSGSGGSAKPRSRSGSEKSSDVLHQQMAYGGSTSYHNSLQRSNHPNQRTNQHSRPLSAIPPNLSNSQQSFQQAMGNPCDYFVDVM
uniref:Dishevelled homolog n=1 Tax=Ciona intestinalis TaxID=7719 RepID=Q9NL46_CIOIN|nr:dishevelled homolog [Ciona intestinalis]BAA92183.1 dishevelled homolog [Ciona intestinalis]|eukprot:NP_001027754.1 dishevelled homolog [Ciona intestinalis]